MDITPGPGHSSKIKARPPILGIVVWVICLIIHMLWLWALAEVIIDFFAGFTPEANVNATAVLFIYLPSVSICTLLTIAWGIFYLMGDKDFFSLYLGPAVFHILVLIPALWVALEQVFNNESTLPTFLQLGLSLAIILFFLFGGLYFAIYTKARKHIVR